MGLILFKDCTSDYKFRFKLLSKYPNIGDVFNINGIYFNGFASVIEYDDIGDVFESDGTLFVEQESCPEPINTFQVPFEPGISPGDAIQNFCVSTQYSTLNSNTGNYLVANVLHDDYVYYTGQTGGFIYFNTDRDQWCLSGTLGGDN